LFALKALLNASGAIREGSEQLGFCVSQNNFGNTNTYRDYIESLEKFDVIGNDLESNLKKKCLWVMQTRYKISFENWELQSQRRYKISKNLTRQIFNRNKILCGSCVARVASRNTRT